MSTDAQILLVDDEGKNLQLLGSVLQPEGYKLSFAKNGEKAIELAQAKLFDLILLDVMMPDLDGYSVCQKLREHWGEDCPPIIFLTAKSETSDLVQGFTAGAVDYLTKPFIAEELLQRVRNHISLQLTRRDLKQKNKELSELYQENKELLGIAAHDIKNPVAGIRGCVRVVLSNLEEEITVSDDSLEMLEIIEKTSNRILSIVESLLSTQSIESPSFTLNKEIFGVNTLLGQLIELNNPTALQKSIRVIHESKDAIIPYHADRSALHEVMENLLSNAIKYSLPETTVRCGWQLNDDKTSLRCYVKDEGPGLTDNDLERVFGRFQKLSARPTGEESSTGLGLSIAKKLVELHGGEIAVANRAEKGAMFYFDLPYDETQFLEFLD